MIIGVPKEIKNNENRVAISPAGVFELVQNGHKVVIQKDAGKGSSIADEEYVKAGAEILPDAAAVWAAADIIYKVKELLPAEFDYVREGQVIFSYLHLAPDPAQTKALVEKKAIGVAFETVELADGSLPLLTPMSEVAGRMAVQVGSNLLQGNIGGNGTLLGGVPGVEPATVVVFGAGKVGINAAKMAAGMGARVTILDLNLARLAYVDDVFQGKITTLVSNKLNAFEACAKADLLVSGVLVPGAKAPKIITEDMVKAMKKGSVIVDCAIDQGGSVETMDKATSFDDPYFVKHDVIHYSVPNMPGAFPHTSTFALTAATLPYLVKMANMGVEEACKADPCLMKGLNVYKGAVTYKGVSEAHGMEYVDPATLF